nr:hypothetical protein [Porcincola intestinalis]
MITKRNVSVAHKSEQDSLQHTDRIVSNTTGYMCQELFQVSVEINFLHKFPERENRITNI